MTENRTPPTSSVESIHMIAEKKIEVTIIFRMTQHWVVDRDVEPDCYV